MPLGSGAFAVFFTPVAVLPALAETYVLIILKTSFTFKNKNFFIPFRLRCIRRSYRLLRRSCRPAASGVSVSCFRSSM